MGGQSIVGPLSLDYGTCIIIVVSLFFNSMVVRLCKILDLILFVFW